MNILFVQRQPCIRTLKYVEGFRTTHPQFDFSFAYEQETLTEFYGHGDEHFLQWRRLGDDPARVLREMVVAQEIDIIHCHNGPDELTNLCIDCFGGRIPIVHDIHDLMSARLTDYDDARDPVGDGTRPETRVALEVWRQQERRAIEQSDAVIAVSDEILAIADRRGYRRPANAEVYANYIPERFIPDALPDAAATDPDRPLRVVYEGSLNTDGGHYDLREIFAALAGQGFEVHIHPARPAPAYRDLAASIPGIVCHDSLPPERLYEVLPGYDLGWAGFNDALNGEHLETVLPNKLFEYIACGLPVLSFRHRALASFIERHSVGLIISDLAEIPTELSLARLAVLRRSVDLQRWDFTVEANIDRVADVYNRLLARPTTLSGTGDLNAR